VGSLNEDGLRERPLSKDLGRLWQGKPESKGGKSMEIIALFYLYHILIFMLGLGIPRTWRALQSRGEHRFVVVIPAHNEENVIRESVLNIRSCNYPAGRFDVCVIADNCTDRTAELAESAGALVLQRFNRELVGKQHAIKWAFEQIYLDEYDAVIILDADNHIDPNYLNVMDDELSKGNRVIQGYLDAKNPGDSWVTANYAYMTWYGCRLLMARKFLGLSAWLGGTGMCIRTDVINRVGWDLHTLTDDVEYTCQLIIAGEKVSFASDAIVYDQKPTKIMDSLRQRLRWMRGQTQTCIRYMPSLLMAMGRFWWKGNLGQVARVFDALMWIPMHVMIFAAVVLSVHQGWWQYLLSVFLSVPTLYILPLAAEQIKFSRVWAYLFTGGAFFLTWIPITAYGVISCGNKKWWRTPH